MARTAKSSWTRGRLRSGLTLVELAVAACSLALLAAALSPAITVTRQQDRLAACLSNLRTLGAASLAYAAADPNELFVPLPNLEVLPAGVGAFEWGGKAGRGSPSQQGNDASSYWGTANFRGPAHRPLNQSLYSEGITNWNPVDGTPQPGPGGINYLNDTRLDLDVYRCPADTGYAGGGFLYTASTSPQRNERPFSEEGLTAYDHYGNSYVASVLTISGGGLVSLRSQSILFAPLSAVPNPGRTIAYQEVPSRFAWIWGSWQGSGCEWAGYEDRVMGNFSTIAGWHAREFGFTIAFADGHAAMTDMRGCIRPPSW